MRSVSSLSSHLCNATSLVCTHQQLSFLLFFFYKICSIDSLLCQFIGLSTFTFSDPQFPILFHDCGDSIKHISYTNFSKKGERKVMLLFHFQKLSNYIFVFSEVLLDFQYSLIPFSTVLYIALSGIVSNVQWSGCRLKKRQQAIPADHYTIQI